MKIWAKEWKNNQMLRDITIEQVCYEFDLPKPLWLDSNVREFQKHARCRFYQDSFVEEIPFQYLELQVIEED